MSSSNDKITESYDVSLRNRSDWPFWFASLQIICKDRGIWKLVDPDAETVKPIMEFEPVAPTIPDLPANPVRRLSTEFNEEDKVNQQAEFDKIYDLEVKDMEKAIQLRKSMIESYPLEATTYKIQYTQWQSQANKLSNTRDWINKTVAKDLLASSFLKLLNSGETTP